MEIIELKAQPRLMTGKKGAKACRKDGMLPGVLYGHGEETKSVAVSPKQLDQALRTQAGSNVIIKLTLDDSSDSVNVIVKELQVDNIKGTMRHVDFCQVSLDKKIRSSVPFRMVGESPGVDIGGILEHILWNLEVECLPLDIPDQIEVDISTLEIGDNVNVSQLVVPENVTVITEWDATVVHVVAPRVEEEPVVAEEELEGEEPEVIDEDAKEEGATGDKEKAEGKEGKEGKEEK